MREKLAKEIMDEMGDVTYEEALEMADMELKAKKNFKHYEQSKVERKKKKNERKVDEVKKDIFSKIEAMLAAEDIEITNKKTETELSFSLSGNNYTLKLTRHRKKKGE